MHSLNDMTGPLADRENVLPALRSAQIELVDRVEVYGGIGVEPAWKKLKKLFDRGGVHGLWEGYFIRMLKKSASGVLASKASST